MSGRWPILESGRAQGRSFEVPKPLRAFGFEEGATHRAEANRSVRREPLGAWPTGAGGGAWARFRAVRDGAGAMSAPQPLQIREANAHLAAVHRRAAELEARLDAAERTVSAQAERLARHDQQLRAALEELGRAKDW